MGFLIDLILILTFAFTVIFYTYKGFIKSCFGLCKYLIAFVIAHLFAPTLSEIIFDSFMYDSINRSVYNWMSDIISNTEAQLNIQEFINKFPEFITKLLENIGVSLNSLVENPESAPMTEEALSNIATSVSSSIAEFISTALAYVSIFVVSVIVLTILVFILDKICKLPVLKQLNKTLGCIFGIICAIINVMAVCAIITLVLNIVGIEKPELIPDIISDKTIVYNFISNINIFSWSL